MVFLSVHPAAFHRVIAAWEVVFVITGYDRTPEKASIRQDIPPLLDHHDGLRETEDPGAMEEVT